MIKPSDTPATAEKTKGRLIGRGIGPATGAALIGSALLGALAMGAVAIGAAAIGSLVIGRARIGRLEIGRLVIKETEGPVAKT
jgi:hypothetical protein